MAKLCAILDEDSSIYGRLLPVPESYGAALFLYQLPLSAYQIGQAKIATVRIP